MSAVLERPVEGGCLCGALRYRLEPGPVNSAYCHCRMCQRASGAPALPWFTVAVDRFAYTAGVPAVYRSSSFAVREFCRRCGSPIVFRIDGETCLDVTNISLDEPNLVPPTYHIWCMSKVAWFETTDDYPRYADRGADV